MISEDIYYIGVDDRDIDLFEGMYKVPNGVAYNSYIIKDEKTAVMDTVDAHFESEWLKNVENVAGGKSPDYLIVQHVEPDHSACIAAFVKRYPNAIVVGNDKTFTMLGEYFGDGFPENRLSIKDGDELCLGKRKLKFVFAPMVHWPEVMLTYDGYTHTLFSADGFGKFGALCFDNGEWADEARRYYIGIVGKYGVQVRTALKKLSDFKVETIAPLHGPALKGEVLSSALNLYGKWSSYEPEEEGTFIAYASVYGHSAEAAKTLESQLKERGEKVKTADLARADWADCVAQAFKFSKLVVVSPTYNGDIFPACREFIDRLTERNFQNRTVAFIENGSWAPVAARLMRAKFEKCKNIVFAENTVKINAALNGESRAKIKALAAELLK